MVLGGDKKDRPRVGDSLGDPHDNLFCSFPDDNDLCQLTNDGIFLGAMDH